jgi:hypothetical protein
MNASFLPQVGDPWAGVRFQPLHVVIALIDRICQIHPTTSSGIV